MAGEWQTVEFGQVIVGGTRNGVYKTNEFHGSGVKIVNMGELFAHPRLYDVPMNRLELANIELRKSSLEPGDLLFARRSLVAEGAGKCSIVMEVNEPTTFESSIIRARPDPAKADSLFLYYLFNSPQGHYLLGTILRQVAVSGITGSDLVQLKISLPTLSEQQAIACILGALDDKIEQNQRMNETLEAMARAIFKSWFVDFDPVRAKALGTPGPSLAQPAELGLGAPRLPAHVADLFPDSFKESELGEIPKGWSVGILEDTLAVLETGSRPRGGVGEIYTGVPSIGAESIVGIGKFDFTKTKYVPEQFFEAMKKGHVESRDVLLYKDGGRPGEYEPHVSMFGDGFPFEEMCINEHVYRLRANSRSSQPFLFFWLTSCLVMDEMRVKGTGVAIPGLNSTAVKSLTTLFPARRILDFFTDLVEPLIARILSNCNESRILATLRDTLLPKLISGELRVPDAERIIERCM